MEKATGTGSSLIREPRPLRTGSVRLFPNKSSKRSLGQEEVFFIGLARSLEKRVIRSFGVVVGLVFVPEMPKDLRIGSMGA